MHFTVAKSSPPLAGGEATFPPGEANLGGTEGKFFPGNWAANSSAACGGGGLNPELFLLLNLIESFHPF